MGKFNFKPFDKVLVRDYQKVRWRVSFYGYYSNKDEEGDSTDFVHRCCDGNYRFCIPYEGNEHLLGTTDDYVEPWQPKDGDFVVMYERFIAICKNPQIDEDGGYKFNVYAYSRLSYDDKLYFMMPCTKQEKTRLATNEEKETFLSKLAEIGKKWNPEKKCIEDVWQPKDGDFMHVSTHMSPRGYIFIHKSNRKLTTYYATYDVQEGWTSIDGTCCDNDDIEELRPATEEEKQQILDALHKENKDWDAEKKEIVEYKWKPSTGDSYYYISEDGSIRQTVWLDYIKDKACFDYGNCFRTEAEAQAMADKFKDLLKGK